MIRWIGGLTLLLAAAYVSPAAFASGFYLADIGTRGLGRAGAFVASPDSLLAIHYNPAGLSHLRGIHAEGSLTFVSMSVDFRRSCPCVIDTSDAAFAAEQDARLEGSFANNPVTSDTVLTIPFVGAAFGLPFYDLTFAFALWGPNSQRHDFGELPRTSSLLFEGAAEGQPGRYSGMRVETFEANFAFGFGLQPLEGLRVGASLMAFQSGNTQTLHLWANSNTLGANITAEDPRLDIPLLFDFKESFAVNWSVGASYELVDGLSIGSSLRWVRNIETDGTIDVQIPRKVILEDLEDDVRIAGNEVVVELATAPLVRAGIQYRMPEVFTAEAAVVWEGWGVHDEVLVTPKDVSFEILGNVTPLEQIVAVRRWTNTTSFRLGGELDLFDPFFSARAGYFYEPTAVPPRFLDPSWVDLDKHGFALGLRTSWFGFTLDVSAMYIALASEQVRASEKALTAPLTGLENYLTIVGNGDYSGSYLLTSIGLSYTFDPLAL